MAVESEEHVDKKMKKKKKMRLHKRGVIYVGHLPHGFYEEELKNFFSQFGVVNRVRVVRSRKTGRSKGYAFIEFKYEDVAKIAVETMNNYLLYNKVLKCSHVQKPKNFWPKSNTTLLSSVNLNREKHNSVKSEDKIEKRKQKILNKIEKTENALAALGIKYALNRDNSGKTENEKIEESSSVNQQDDNKKSFEAIEIKCKTKLGKETSLDKNESLIKKEDTLKRKKSTDKIKKNKSKIPKFEKEMEIDDTDEIANEVTDKVMENTKFSPKESTRTSDIGTDNILKKTLKQKENYETTFVDNFKEDPNFIFNNSMKLKKSMESPKENLKNSSLIKNDKTGKETPKQARERNIKLISENDIENNVCLVSVEKDSNKSSTQKKKHSDSSDIREEMNTSNIDKIKKTKLTPKNQAENNDNLVSVGKDSNKSSTQKKKHSDSSDVTEEMDKIKKTKLTPKNHAENNDNLVSVGKDSNKSSTQKKKHSDSSDVREEMNTSNIDKNKKTKLTPKNHAENNDNLVSVGKDSNKSSTQKKKKHSDSSDIREEMSTSNVDETKNMKLTPKNHAENNDNLVSVGKDSNKSSKQKKKHSNSDFSGLLEEMNTSNIDEMKYTKLTPKESLESSRDLDEKGSKKTPKQKTKKHSDSHSDFGEDMNLCEEEIKHTKLFLEGKLENDEFDDIKKTSENETKAVCDIDNDIKNQKISSLRNVETSKTPLSKRSPRPRSCKKSKQLNNTDGCIIVEMPDQGKKEIEKNDVEFDDFKEEVEEERDIDKDRKITGILSNSGKKKRLSKYGNCKNQSTVKFNEKKLDSLMKVKSDFHQLKDSTTRRITRKNERDIQALSSSYTDGKMETTLPKRSPKFRSCKK